MKDETNAVFDPEAEPQAQTRRECGIRNSSFVIFFAVLVFTAACSPDPASRRAGGAAPDFRLSGLSGRTVFLNAELRRPVVLTFFATWCAPCREEIPLLIDLDRRFKDRITILCVVADPENIDKVRSIASRLKIPYPMLLDEGQRTQKAYGVRELPATFFIGTDGRILSRFDAFGEDEKRALIEAIGRAAKGGR